MTLVVQRHWRVAHYLHMGSAPPPGPLPGFQLLVLAAREYQPEGAFPYQRVIHAGMDDGPPVTSEEASSAVASAVAVAQAMSRGETSLVTCWAGLNRSGLIAALALVFAHGATGDSAIAAVRRARGQDALSNQHFRDFIRRAAASFQATSKML